MTKKQEYTGPEPKQKSRKKTDDEFGNAINFNMHEDDLERLIEIGVWLGIDKIYGTSGKLKYKLFRKTVSDLINIFYISRLSNPETNEAKELKKIHTEFYKIMNVEKMTPMEQKAHLSALFPPPDILVSQEILKKNKRKWLPEHLDGLSDYRLVVNSISKLNHRGD